MHQWTKCKLCVEAKSNVGVKIISSDVLKALRDFYLWWKWKEGTWGWKGERSQEKSQLEDSVLPGLGQICSLGNWGSRTVRISSHQALLPSEINAPPWLGNVLPHHSLLASLTLTGGDIFLHLFHPTPHPPWGCPTTYSSPGLALYKSLVTGPHLSFQMFLIFSNLGTILHDFQHFQLSLMPWFSECFSSTSFNLNTCVFLMETFHHY